MIKNYLIVALLFLTPALTFAVEPSIEARPRGAQISESLLQEAQVIVNDFQERGGQEIKVIVYAGLNQVSGSATVPYPSEIVKRYLDSTKQK